MADAAALLTRQVGPHLFQARERVFELRQFDLELRFRRAGARGEDVEDQLAAVDHFDFEGLFEVARLAGRQIVIEQNHVGVVRLNEFFQFAELALADVGVCLDVLAFLGELADDAGAGGGRQAANLVARIFAQPRAVGQGNAHQNCFFEMDRQFVAVVIEGGTDTRFSGNDSRVVKSMLRFADSIQ